MRPAHEKARQMGRGIAYAAIVITLRAAMRLVLGLRIACDAQVRALKKSREAFLVLSQHPSMLDAAVLYAAMYPRRIHTVAGRFQFVGKRSRRLFETLGAISKKQFYPDMGCVRQMLGVLRAGGVLAMMPEGRISMDGTSNPIEPSTAAFVRRCGVSVVVLQLEGSYFVMPCWRKRAVSPGRVRARLRLLYTPQTLAGQTAAQVRRTLNDALSYNQFAQNEKRRPRYFGRPAGMSAVTYRCAACGALGTMRDDGKVMWCTSCGLRLRLRRDRFFDPGDGASPFESLAAWNAWQMEQERLFFTDAKALVAYPAVCRPYDNDARPGTPTSGIVRLGVAGFSYTLRDGTEVFFRPLEKLTGMSAGYAKGTIMLCTKDGALEFVFQQPCCAAHLVNALTALREKYSSDGDET